MEDKKEYGILKTIRVKTKVNEQTGKTSYRTVFSTKTIEGNKVYKSMFIRFINKAKNMIVENDQFINIIDGFISFNLDKDGKETWVLVISDFDYNENSSNNEFDYSDDDLPF